MKTQIGAIKLKYEGETYKADGEKLDAEANKFKDRIS